MGEEEGWVCEEEEGWVGGEKGAGWVRRRRDG